ncbi:hypothetical protein Dimus_021806 [Dionaea muscipula]
MAMARQVVKVRRDKIAACMTCPLCNKLLKEATTISLCLHTFCRKCIYEKFSDEDVGSCPVCDIILGAVPVDKLRPDHNLQDIRSKIFPMKKKVEFEPPPETVYSVSPPPKRKERSLSSLVVSAPRVPMETSTVTGRRTRGGVRKVVPPRGTSPAEEPLKRDVDDDDDDDDDSKEDSVEGSSSPETLNKILQSCSAKSSSNDQTLRAREDMENSSGPWDGKVYVWKPLNRLVEAANCRTKLSKSKSKGPILSHPKSEVSGAIRVDDFCLGKMKIEDGGAGKAEADHGENKSTNVVASLISKSTSRRKKHPPTNHTRETTRSDSCSSPQLGLDDAKPIVNGHVWFSLVAADNKDRGGASLPQISAGYLRVKDSSMTLSHIKKYLAKKLDLNSTETEEVEVSLQGQPLLPTLELQSVLQLWLQTAPTSDMMVQTTVGSSAEEFVMVLNYSLSPISS